MALSVFDDKAAPPSPEAVAAALGQAAAARWATLLDETRRCVGEITEAWGFSSPKAGWSMRVMARERVIAYVTPQREAMLVGVVLGEKAIAAATAAGGISAATAAHVAAAPKYAEGRGVRLVVASDEDLRVAIELVRAKAGR